MKRLARQKIICYIKRMIKNLIELANDNLVMEPLDALVTACAILVLSLNAPRHTQCDDDSLFMTISYEGQKFLLSFNGEQWENSGTI